MEPQKIILSYVSKSIRQILESISIHSFNTIQEIRIRMHQPLMISRENIDYFLTPEGHITKEVTKSYIVNPTDLKESLQLMSEYSIYAFEEELKNGFITLPGGHRVGIVGKAVMEDGRVKTLRHISGLNIRICHEVLGCSEHVLPYILQDDSIYHTLIVSPPACGKTTLLRDLVHKISTGIPEKFEGINVGVVDERSEIAGCYKGVPQNQLGYRTDVLDGCPKVEGIMMLLRSMAPKVIAVDEIGKEEDIYALWSALNAGVKILATVHGSSVEDIIRKPVFSEMMKEKFFDRIIILTNKKGPGSLSKVVDGVTGKTLLELG